MPGTDGVKLMRIVRFLLVTFVLAVLASGVSGCNTVRGAGKDLKQGGQAIENAADRVAN